MIAEGTASVDHDVPKLVLADGDILCLRDGGGNAFWFTFYDVERERVSKEYEYVIDLRGGNVLYTDRMDDGWHILLADVFDGEVLCSLPIDLRTAEGWVEDAEWNDESGAWVITFLAGEEYEETTVVFPPAQEPLPALYPIRENGRWGYMNRAGDVVIAPRWARAWPFEGGTALVSTGEDDLCYGLIDRQAEWVLEPEYDIYPMDYLGRTPETGYGLYAVFKDGQMGYFDRNTGFFSGLRWTDVWDAYTESPLLAVRDPETDATGYVDRASGEQVIPGLYHTFYPALFYEGIAVVEYEDEEWYGDGDPGGFMIDETGTVIPLPEGITAVYGARAACGRVAVEDKNGQKGYADLRGRVVIPPQYLYADDFCEDRAAVQAAEGEWAIIGLDGKTILENLTARPDDYHGGVVTAEQNGTRACFDAEGRLLPNRTPDMLEAGDGLFWMPAGGTDQPNCYWWSWRLTDGEGHVLSEAVQLDYPVFDGNGGSFFHGLQPVGDGLGHWGYMNRQGEMAIPCRYDSADPFRDGLALVVKDGKLMYIDPSGAVVWEER